jgi:hypothetical protein
VKVWELSLESKKRLWSRKGDYLGLLAEAASVIIAAFTVLGFATRAVPVIRAPMEKKGN